MDRGYGRTEPTPEFGRADFSAHRAEKLPGKKRLRISGTGFSLCFRPIPSPTTGRGRRGAMLAILFRKHRDAWVRVLLCVFFFYNRAAVRAALNSVPHLTACQWHLSFRARDQTVGAGIEIRRRRLVCVSERLVAAFVRVDRP
jgi:hypothetical protein